MRRNKHLHLYDITKCIYHCHHQKLHESYCEDDLTIFVTGGVNLAVNNNSCKRTHAASIEQILRCPVSSSSSRLGCLRTRADLFGQKLAS